jgi:hydrogenase maturation protein HypF
MPNLLIPNKTPPTDRAAPENAANADGKLAFCITLRGRVQGFGVRPTIARLAQTLGVTGFVVNCKSGVQIYVEGPPDLVERFCSQLKLSLPPGSRLEEIHTEEAAVAGTSEFCIKSTHFGGPLSAHVPPDIVVCPECLAEAADSRNRRFAHMFTTCTRCGPRYSLIRDMPYDRESTEMAQFELCNSCRTEYGAPGDRRFHSQTNSCPQCGPRLWLSAAEDIEIAEHEATLDDAITALCSQKILAVKGIGGYQLVVDATSPAAVQELRRRKQRYGKPLAVMVQDLCAAELLAGLDDIERQALTDSSNPIVVAPRRPSIPLACEVTGGLNTVGLMLPSTPLHEFLARRAGRHLVVTSGNFEGDPLAFETTKATGELFGAADLFLHHDRPISQPIDDSVVRVIAGRRSTVRLARGLAPFSLKLDCAHAILALGGHQKAAIALSNGAQAVLGPHVGDLEHEAMRARYLAHVKSLCNLYGMTPEFIAHDLHPDYFTSRWASEQPVPKVAVQHHHAHVVAGMLEHDWLDRQVLGVAWDGTGYGADGSIWGGEFLLATATDFKRVGSLRSFALPGSEAAVRQPWRVAVSLVHQALGADVAVSLQFPNIPQQQTEQLVRLIDRPGLWPRTTSMGRLFDGVASLVLGVAASQFEGQAAMLLESACDLSAAGAYPLPICDGEPITLDWRPLIVGVVNDLAASVDSESIAMKFHRSLASGIIAMCSQFHEVPIVLSGGCFNNRILTELVADRFNRRSQHLGLPGPIPVNDGGLAAGQLAVAVARLKGENRAPREM